MNEDPINLNIEDILAQLSANGKLEWECAVLRAQNAALQQRLIPDADESPVGDDGAG